MSSLRSSGVVPNLTVQQLEYLVAVADSSTWAVAASDLGCTPSALSQGLAELERRVGITLFERDGRRRVLVAAAEPVLVHAREILARTTDLARYASRVREGTGGLLRIGMIDAAAVQHFPDALRQFRSSRPDVDMRLTVDSSATLVEKLGRAELDLVVCVAPPVPVESVVTTPLMSEPLALLAPDRISLESPPSNWGPWVGFPVGSHTRQLIQHALRQIGARYEVVAESHQPEVLREMVSVGLGWTVLPPPVGRQVTGGPAWGETITERKLVIARRLDAVPNPIGEALERALHEATKNGPTKVEQPAVE